PRDDTRRWYAAVHDLHGGGRADLLRTRHAVPADPRRHTPRDRQHQVRGHPARVHVGAGLLRGDARPSRPAGRGVRMSTLVQDLIVSLVALGAVSTIALRARAMFASK